MKAKNKHSHFLEKASARGAMAIFAMLTVFIAGFVAWGASCFGGACVSYVKSMY